MDIEPHSEDYSEPFKWNGPYGYYLCRACHRTYLHGRFRNPTLWQAHLAHVRRGGYSSDLRDPVILREVERYRRALKKKEGPPALKGLGRSRLFPERAWWEQLTMDPSSLTDQSRFQTGIST